MDGVERLHGGLKQLYEGAGVGAVLLDPLIKRGAPDELCDNVAGAVFFKTVERIDHAGNILKCGQNPEFSDKTPQAESVFIFTGGFWGDRDALSHIPEGAASGEVFSDGDGDAPGFIPGGIGNAEVVIPYGRAQPVPSAESEAHVQTFQTGGMTAGVEPAVGTGLIFVCDWAHASCTAMCAADIHGISHLQGFLYEL